MTNVRGCSNLLFIGKSPVHSLVGFVPPPTGVSFGICVISYNNNIAVSVEADENVMQTPTEFMDEMLLELEHQRTALLL